MHVHHPDAKLSCRFDCHSCRIGNIVEFQIEEHFESTMLQSFDDLRPAARKELLSYLRPAIGRIEPICEVESGSAGGEIEGDNDRSLAGRHESGLGLNLGTLSQTLPPDSHSTHRNDFDPSLRVRYTLVQSAAWLHPVLQNAAASVECIDINTPASLSRMHSS